MSTESPVRSMRALLILLLAAGCVGNAPGSGADAAVEEGADAAAPGCTYASAWATEDDFSYPAAYSTQFTALKRSPDGALYRVGLARMSIDGSLGHRWLARKRTQQGWSLVDDYQFSPASSNVAFNLDIDTAGSVLVTGSSYQTDQVIWFGRRSNDGGTTWTESAGYSFPTGGVGHGLRLVRDGNGDAYEVGAYGAGAGILGLTRKSTDDGDTWTTVDDHQVAGGAPTEITLFRGLHITATNQLYVVGYYMDAGGRYTPLIRTSPPGGADWSTLAGPSITGAAELWDMTGDSGNLFLIATVGETTARHWEIYRSTDGGAAWALVDSYQLAAGHRSDVRDIQMTRRGEIFVAGLVTDDQDRFHWLVRRSSDEGQTWVTSDEFLLPDGRDVIENYEGYESIYLGYDEMDQTVYANGVGILRQLVCE